MSSFMCCDRKSRAACAQSFALWQQASDNRDHASQSLFACASHHVQSFTRQYQQSYHVAISLTIACLRYVYNGVILHAHPVCGDSHNQRNTTGEVATHAMDSGWEVVVGGPFFVKQFTATNRHQNFNQWIHSGSFFCRRATCTVLICCNVLYIIEFRVFPSTYRTSVLLGLLSLMMFLL